jgi:thiol-disulfide isomerase/thioredoxin
MDPRVADGSERTATSDGDDVVPKAFVLGADATPMMVSNKDWVVPNWAKAVFFFGAVGMVAGLITYKVVERRRYEAMLVDTVMDAVPMTQTAPAFTLADGDGNKPVSLADFKGRYVFINFWATWCSPCREEMPSLEYLTRTFGKDVVFLAISVDEDWNEVKKFFGKDTPRFKVLWDASRQVTRAYGTEKFPESYLVDPQGNLMAKFIGPRDWNSNAANEYFRRIAPRG